MVVRNGDESQGIESVKNHQLAQIQEYHAYMFFCRGTPTKPKKKRNDY